MAIYPQQALSPQAGILFLTSTYSPMLRGGKVKLTGNVASVATSTGRVGYTIERRAVCVYCVNYSTTYPNANYTPSVTVTGIYTYVLLGGNTLSAKLEVVSFSSPTVNACSPLSPTC